MMVTKSTHKLTAKIYSWSVCLNLDLQYWQSLNQYDRAWIYTGHLIKFGQINIGELLVGIHLGPANDFLGKQSKNIKRASHMSMI
jgi:hypothetical protein